MTKVDRSTYAAFSNKLSQGTPNQYWVQRFIDHISISVYPTPDSTNASKDMHFYYIKRIQDIGAYTNATDMPFRFIPCMVSGLTYYLSMKYATANDSTNETSYTKMNFKEHYKKMVQLLVHLLHLKLITQELNMDKDKIQNIAEELADSMYGKDFYDLSGRQQSEVYSKAIRELNDMLADRADIMRKGEKYGGRIDKPLGPGGKKKKKKKKKKKNKK